RKCAEWRDLSLLFDGRSQNCSMRDWLFTSSHLAELFLEFGSRPENIVEYIRHHCITRSIESCKVARAFEPTHAEESLQLTSTFFQSVLED
ncbi:hypothetical protein PENTCL1PPCAC_1439, partial [Pristionchus entomophagus]